MTIEKTVKYSGNVVTSSNDGKMIIDQTAGEIIVRDGNNVRRYYLGSEKITNWVWSIYIKAKR